MAHRRGMALVMVLAVLFTLLLFGFIVRLLSASAYREVDTLQGYLRALAVGEVAFGETVTRLTARPWSERWFRGRAEVRTDVAAAGGTYALVIADATTSGPASDEVRQADLLVRATCERSTVCMFWRLTVPPGSLDAHPRLTPTFYTSPPEETPATPPALAALGAQVTGLLTKRRENTPPFESLRPQLTGATTPGQVAGLLGLPADPGLAPAAQPPPVTPAGSLPPESAPPPIPPDPAGTGAGGGGGGRNGSTPPVSPGSINALVGLVRKIACAFGGTALGDRALSAANALQDDFTKAQSGTLTPADALAIGTDVTRGTTALTEALAQRPTADFLTKPCP